MNSLRAMQEINLEVPPVLTHEGLKALQKEIKRLLKSQPEISRFEFDFTNVQQIDSAAAVFLHNLKSDLQKKAYRFSGTTFLQPLITL